MVVGKLDAQQTYQIICPYANVVPFLFRMCSVKAKTHRALLTLRIVHNWWRALIFSTISSNGSRTDCKMVFFYKKLVTSFEISVHFAYQLDVFTTLYCSSVRWRLSLASTLMLLRSAQQLFQHLTPSDGEVCCGSNLLSSLHMCRLSSFADIGVFLCACSFLFVNFAVRPFGNKITASVIFKRVVEVENDMVVAHHQERYLVHQEDKPFCDRIACRLRQVGLEFSTARSLAIKCRQA